MMSRVSIFYIVLMLLGCSAEKKAMKTFRLGEYQRTIDYYKSILNKKSDTDNKEAYYYIAESYRLSNRYKEAMPYFEKAKGLAEKNDSILFYYAQSLKANGQYAQATQQLDELYAALPDTEFRVRVGDERNALHYLEDLDKQKSYYEIKTMDVINTDMSEYAPVYLNNELYFTASRKGAKLYMADATPFTKLYKVKTLGANVDVSTLTALSPNINSSHANNGCITFSPSGKTAVFAKGNTGKRGSSHDVDLYVSRFIRGAWSPARSLNINMLNAWESTPAFSEDGRTLYFSSNRKGGMGGLDIYAARVSSRGRFSRPVNMGAAVNTAGDELFPYMSPNNQFYFSSDGHPGYGMLDLFKLNRTGGKAHAENLGKPVNSAGDDFGIFLFKPDRGFFTSNREGGMGDDDIYTFVNHDPNLKVVNYALEGVVLTLRENEVQEVIPNAKVALFNSEGEPMQDLVTGTDGKFLFRVYEDEDYTLVGEAEGYLVKRQSYTTKGKSVSRDVLTELVTDIKLDTIIILEELVKDKVFVLQNIYFDFDKYNINASAARELDKLTDILNDNPEIVIEMGSHTDSVASREYNIELSQKRAESTVNYLISKGIPSARLTAKGYGENRPVARNTNPDGSDNPEGRRLNRRTEFKILEIGRRNERSRKEEKFEDNLEEDFEEDKYFREGN